MRVFLQSGRTVRNTVSGERERGNRREDREMGWDRERERESSLWLRNSFTADENQITVILLKICLREQTATVSVKALISFIAKFETK